MSDFGYRYKMEREYKLELLKKQLEELEQYKTWLERHTGELYSKYLREMVRLKFVYDDISKIQDDIGKMG